MLSRYICICKWEVMQGLYHLQYQVHEATGCFAVQLLSAFLQSAVQLCVAPCWLPANMARAFRADVFVFIANIGC